MRFARQSLLSQSELRLTPISLATWQERCRTLPQMTITQSAAYAAMLARTSTLRPFYYLLTKEGRDIAAAQIMIARALGGMIEAVILDRGPIWSRGEPNTDDARDFFESFAAAFPARLGRRRRIIPELPQGILNANDWAAMGYRAAPGTVPYQTIWLDLTRSPEDLRKDLDKNWRYDLKQAESAANVNVVLSSDPRAALPVIQANHLHRQAVGYTGLNPRDLAILVASCARQDGVLVASVMQGETLLAGAVFLRHGCTATYQIGYVSAAGRAAHANHALLWQSILHLKTCGVLALDLGGVNAHTGGITHFKKGLGGHHVTLAGHFF